MRVETERGFPVSGATQDPAPRSVSTCNRPLVYMGLSRHCERTEGHAGPCRIWVEEADLEDEPRLWSEPDELKPEGLGR